MITSAKAHKARARRLLRNYGITPEEYDALDKAQGGGCAVCRRPPKKLRHSVDHDHGSGLVRGILCWRCNDLIGKSRDSVELLFRAVEYLKNPPALKTLGARYGVRGRVTLTAAGRRRALRFVRRG